MHVEHVGILVRIHDFMSSTSVDINILLDEQQVCQAQPKVSLLYPPPLESSRQYHTVAASFIENGALLTWRLHEATVLQH